MKLHFSSRLLLSILFFAIPIITNAQYYKISTVCGDGTSAYKGDSGLAINAQINQPQGIFIDNAGNMYIADTYNFRVRKIDAATGKIYTIAGDGVYAPPTNGALATSTHISTVSSICVDDTGNVYICDYDNSIIEKVDTAGVLTIVAGNGKNAYAGDGGKATVASLGLPVSVCLDKRNNLYISDQQFYVVRKVNLATGIITTVAGDGTPGFTGDGNDAKLAELNNPSAIFADKNSNIYICDGANNRIRLISDTTGHIFTIVGTGMAGFAGDGGVGRICEIESPVGIYVNDSGVIFFSDLFNDRIREVNKGINGGGIGGIIHTIAGNGNLGDTGDGDTATKAQISLPINLYGDKNGNIYFVENGGSRVRKLSPILGSSNITTVSKNKLNYYPNPATNTLWIDCNNAISIQIRSIDGSMIFHTENITSSFLNLDVSNFPVGVYDLSLCYQDGDKQTAPFIKK